MANYSEATICRKCGKEVWTIGLVCKNCGTNNRQQKNRAKPLIMLVTFAVSVVIVLAIVNNAGQQPPRPQQTSFMGALLEFLFYPGLVVLAIGSVSAAGLLSRIFTLLEHNEHYNANRFGLGVLLEHILLGLVLSVGFFGGGIGILVLQVRHGNVPAVTAFLIGAGAVLLTVVIFRIKRWFKKSEVFGGEMEDL